ncbi:zinc-dependent alcohol dehydrogenase family protein [Pelagibius marinus]|uniref:zinc-dependent alcohol dehydrogenase family protein n=1 Tax=Pelagibius marinus TaxID=2762760 RepID=UPI0018725119|nr:NAD(P)-dependent alcohol dehydrogenase [Pelagibius marinus]
MRAWQIENTEGLDGLKLAELELPDPGPGEVRVRLRANAINYRDLSVISDPVARDVELPRIPNSDGAGEVLAVGAGVTGFAPGDRVAGCFFQNWIDGPCTAEAMASAMGGEIEGVLAEERNLRADGLVKIPDHLSFAEAATLPCAGLTAWRALVPVGKLKAGDTVLLLGTGGVSIFALQFATLMGARVIITSSSDEKLAKAKALGAWQTVNYRSTPDWEKAVLEMTEGRGVDLTVEVGGAGTLQKSIAATRIAGTIGFIGILAGGEVNPRPIMSKSLTVQGIYVGSRNLFRDMNRAIAAAELRPVIDRSFAFEDAPEAYRTMKAAGHFGKLVIEI